MAGSDGRERRPSAAGSGQTAASGRPAAMAARGGARYPDPSVAVWCAEYTLAETHRTEIVTGEPSAVAGAKVWAQPVP